MAAEAPEVKNAPASSFDTPPPIHPHVDRQPAASHRGLQLAAAPDSVPYSVPSEHLTQGSRVRERPAGHARWYHPGQSGTLAHRVPVGGTR